MINPIDPTPKVILRDDKGRFPKGVSGNPGGPGKGFRKPSLVEMEKGIKKFEKLNKKEYWAQIPILAMELAEKGNVTLLLKVIDKFYPSNPDREEEETPESLPFMICGPNAN